MKFDVSIGDYVKTELSEGINILFSSLNSLNKLFTSNMYTSFQDEMNAISTDGRLRDDTVIVSSNFSATLLLLCHNASTLELIESIIKAIVDGDKLPLIKWQIKHTEEQLKYYG